MVLTNGTRRFMITVGCSMTSTWSMVDSSSKWHETSSSNTTGGSGTRGGWEIEERERREGVKEGRGERGGGVISCCYFLGGYVDAFSLTFSLMVSGFDG